MQFLQSIILFFLLGYDVLAAPAPQRHHRKTTRSFKVPRVRRDDYIPHGPTALRVAYQKYGITPTNLELDLLDFEPISPEKYASELEKRGTVSATSAQGGAEYVSPVKIGGQTIVMNFDTGSSDFWVVNTHLPDNMTEGHTVFDPSKSTSFKEMEGASFNARYGDSSFAYGNVGVDTVDIGGAVVENQAIGLPTTISDSLIQDTASNGLVGLAFEKLNTVQPQKQKTFFDNVADSLDEPVMTSLLKNGETAGEYEFGKIDHTKYQGKLLNISVDPSGGFWQFECPKFAVGDADAKLQDIREAPYAIADTGTSLMLLSPQVVEAYYAQVQGAIGSVGAGGWVYPCDAKLPSLSVAIGDKGLAKIPGSYMTFSKAGTNKTTGVELCFGGVQSNRGRSQQILGDTFLKSLFVVFDRRGPSLGIAMPA